MVGGGGATTVAADRCSWSTRSRGCFPAQVSSAQASSVEIRSGALLPYILCGFYTPYRRCVPPPPESVGTRFNLCAAYDLASRRASARFGFRSENAAASVGGCRLTSSGRRGFSVSPIVPLDKDGRLLLEAKTNVDLPEPEFVIGTDFDGVSSGDRRSLEMGIGGDVEVEVEEVNLIFSF